MRSDASLILVSYLALPAAPVVAQTRNVDLTAADGVVLKASYSSLGKPRPAILLFHQCSSNGSAYSTVRALRKSSSGLCHDGDPASMPLSPAGRSGQDDAAASEGGGTCVTAHRLFEAPGHGSSRQ